MISLLQCVDKLQDVLQEVLSAIICYPRTHAEFFSGEKSMPQIETKTGDATSPQPENGRGIIIVHIANDEGRWGRGFVLAVNKVSLAGKAAYQGWAKDHNNAIPRGQVQLVELKPDVFVANMIAQQGVDKSAVKNGVLVDYEALKKCMRTVFIRAFFLRCDVHIPSGMGSGLAGGDKTTIHQIIRDCADEVEAKVSFSPPIVVLKVTLWEYDDTSSDSYVAPKTDKVDKSDPVTQAVTTSLDEFLEE